MDKEYQYCLGAQGYVFSSDSDSDFATDIDKLQQHLKPSSLRYELTKDKAVITKHDDLSQFLTQRKKKKKGRKLKSKHVGLYLEKAGLYNQKLKDVKNLPTSNTENRLSDTKMFVSSKEQLKKVKCNNDDEPTSLLSNEKGVAHKKKSKAVKKVTFVLNKKKNGKLLVPYSKMSASSKKKKNKEGSIPDDKQSTLSVVKEKRLVAATKISTLSKKKLQGSVNNLVVTTQTTEIENVKSNLKHNLPQKHIINQKFINRLSPPITSRETTSNTTQEIYKETKFKINNLPENKDKQRFLEVSIVDTIKKLLIFNNELLDSCFENLYVVYNYEDKIIFRQWFRQVLQDSIKISNHLGNKEIQQFLKVFIDHTIKNLLMFNDQLLHSCLENVINNYEDKIILGQWFRQMLNDAYLSNEYYEQFKSDMVPFSFCSTLIGRMLNKQKTKKFSSLIKNLILETDSSIILYYFYKGKNFHHYLHFQEMYSIMGTSYFDHIYGKVEQNKKKELIPKITVNSIPSSSSNLNLSSNENVHSMFVKEISCKIEENGNPRIKFSKSHLSAEERRIDFRELNCQISVTNYIPCKSVQYINEASNVFESSNATDSQLPLISTKNVNVISTNIDDFENLHLPYYYYRGKNFKYYLSFQDLYFNMGTKHHDTIYSRIINHLKKKKKKGRKRKSNHEDQHVGSSSLEKGLQNQKLKDVNVNVISKNIDDFENLHLPYYYYCGKNFQDYMSFQDLYFNMGTKLFDTIYSRIINHPKKKKKKGRKLKSNHEDQHVGLSLEQEGLQNQKLKDVKKNKKFKISNLPENKEKQRFLKVYILDTIKKLLMINDELLDTCFENFYVVYTYEDKIIFRQWFRQMLQDSIKISNLPRNKERQQFLKVFIDHTIKKLLMFNDQLLHSCIENVINNYDDKIILGQWFRQMLNDAYLSNLYYEQFKSDIIPFSFCSDLIGRMLSEQKSKKFSSLIKNLILETTDTSIMPYYFYEGKNFHHYMHFQEMYLIMGTSCFDSIYEKVEQNRKQELIPKKKGVLETLIDRDKLPENKGMANSITYSDELNRNVAHNGYEFSILTKEETSSSNLLDEQSSMQSITFNDDKKHLNCQIEEFYYSIDEWKSILFDLMLTLFALFVIIYLLKNLKFMLGW